MPSVTIKELLEAGVHFGHQTKRWNPKMKDYIYGERNGIHIVDLQKTQKLFEEALEFITKVVTEGKDILIVGTKKQAQEIVEEEAKRAEAFYVNQRWVGGLLTNFPVVRKSIDKLIDLEEMKIDGRWDLISKKEQSRLEKVIKKLQRNFAGIKEMRARPGILFVIDSAKEIIAVTEAKKVGIPVVGVVDTNGDPEVVDYVIPGNDDAIRAVKLYISKVADAIIEGKSKRIVESVVPKEEKESVPAGSSQP
ncbi:MAG: 30S ribosomal protein S2 [Candidatus Aminicenantia bacterium]